MVIGDLVTSALPERRPLASQLVARAEPIPSAALVAAAILFLGFMGGLRVLYRPAFTPFDLDNEQTIPAYFSAALLVAAGLLAFLAAQLAIRRARLPLALLGVLFAYMAVDEAQAIHEQLEQATGIRWQVLYIPILLVAGVAWAASYRWLGSMPPAQHLLAAGAGVWIFAQFLEWVQLDAPFRPGDHRAPLMISEELLEMAGSALFGLALLVAIRSITRRTDGSGRIGRADEPSDADPNASHAQARS